MYDSGDLVPLTVEIKDANGTLTNASAITLTIGLPDGTSASPTPTNPSTGRYQVDFLALQPGSHSVSWTSASPNSAHTDVFEVRVLSPRYIVSLADVKTQLNMTATSNDEELRAFIGAATGVIERHLGQAVVKRVFTEEHSVSAGLLVLTWTPALTLVSVSSLDSSQTWDVSKLHLSSSGIVSPAAGGTAIYGRVSTAHVAGMVVIPEEYGLAARIIVQHLWETQRGNSGNPRAGGLGDSMGSSGRGYAIPNRALELLGGGMPGLA